MKLLNIFIIFIVFTQSEAFSFDCEYDQDTWGILVSVYQCIAEVDSFEESDEVKITKVTGIHLRGKTDDDVELLDIIHQNLRIFPEGIDKHFPNLKGIRVYFNKIKAITKDDLKGFTNLKYFDFRGNDLTILDDDLFTFTPNLQAVGFGYNKIKHIGTNTFKPLKNLETLWFDGENNCYDEIARTRHEVTKLISKFSVYCPPPTCPMLAKEVWNLQIKSEIRLESLKVKTDTQLKILEYYIDNEFRMLEKHDENQFEIVTQIDSFKNQTISTFSSLQTQMDKVETSAKGLETRFETMENKIKGFDSKLDSLKNQIEYLIKKNENMHKK